MISKKGFIDQALVNTASIIVLAIILLVFFFYFNLAYIFIAQHKELINTKNVNDPGLLLNNYLRTPVVGEKASTIGELITNDRDNKDLEKLSSDVLNLACSYNSPQDYCFWELNIKYPDKEFSFISNQGSKYDFRDNVQVQSLLPTIDNKQVILTLTIYIDPYKGFE